MARTKGSLNKDTIERVVAASRALTGAASRAKRGHKMPLDVMLEAMDRAYANGGAIEAFPYAEKVAPYLHPRLTSVDTKVSGDLRVEVVKFAATAHSAA